MLPNAKKQFENISSPHHPVYHHLSHLIICFLIYLSINIFIDKFVLFNYDGDAIGIEVADSKKMAENFMKGDILPRRLRKI